MGAAWSFAAGVSVGLKLAAARDVVNDALDSIYDATEAVLEYLGTVASSALEKLKEAAASVKDIVVKLVRSLRGRKEAAKARREVNSAAAAADVCVAAGASPGSFRRPGSHPGPKSDAWDWDWEPSSRPPAPRSDPNMAVVLSRASARAPGPKSDAWDWDWEPSSRPPAPRSAPNMAVVLSRASGRVAGFRRLQHVKTGLPPPSSAIVSATVPGREFALLGSVATPAARAARRASEMMALLDTAVEAALGDGIPRDAVSCISVVVSAVGIGLEAIAAVAVKDA